MSIERNEKKEFPMRVRIEFNSEWKATAISAGKREKKEPCHRSAVWFSLERSRTTISIEKREKKRILCLTSNWIQIEVKSNCSLDRERRKEKRIYHEFTLWFSSEWIETLISFQKGKRKELSVEFELTDSIRNEFTHQSRSRRKGQGIFRCSSNWIQIEFRSSDDFDREERRKKNFSSTQSLAQFDSNSAELWSDINFDRENRPKEFLCHVHSDPCWYAIKDWSQSRSDKEKNFSLELQFDAARIEIEQRFQLRTSAKSTFLSKLILIQSELGLFLDFDREQREKKNVSIKLEFHPVQIVIEGSCRSRRE